MSTLSLSACLSRNPLTAPLERLSPEGIDWTLSYAHPSEMFWRQLKFGDFDVSEMSLATLFILWAQGVREWVALPIFTTRRFFHTGIVVRAGSGITSPAELRGRRVGVPEYQQTSAVWSRAALEHEFGVAPSEMIWSMERPPELSHGGTSGFRVPDGVTMNYLDPGHTIASQLGRGELDASFVHLTETNLIDRSSSVNARLAKVEPLFSDPKAEGLRYFGSTGLLPINHCVVIRRSIVEAHPWVLLNVYGVFEQAKASVMARTLELLAPYETLGLIDPENAAAVHGGDPLPYGFATQRPVLDAVARFVHEQGLVGHVVDVEELFAKQTHAF